MGIEVGFTRKYIDPRDVEAMASVFATLAEVADFYDLTAAEVRERIQDDEELRVAWRRGRARGRLSLREKQMERAISGNPTMLKFLGKQSDVLAQQETPKAAQKIDVSVRYMAEWGATPGSLGGGEEADAEAEAVEEAEWGAE